MIDETKKYRTPRGEIVTGAELVEVPPVRTAEEVVLWAIQDFARKSPRNSCTQHQCIVTALREAGKIKEPEQPDPEGWIAHDGGPRPVDEDVMVEVRLSTVFCARPRRAGDLIWTHNKVRRSAITHYRVVGE